MRRLDAIVRRFMNVESAAFQDAARRSDIIREEHLRLQVARLNALRENGPALWQELEKDRRSRNRETMTINRRLRAEGLRPIELEPSLEQQVKELQQLEARTRAGSPPRRGRS